MRVAAVDIGTNSMRLLVLAADGSELVRRVEVTGLGTGVDATGRFAAERVATTLEVMTSFGEAIESLGVSAVAAVATSATRDAENGPAFADAVASRIGVRPQIISGQREAALSFAGATANRESGRYSVIDIGGGSTEFVHGFMSDGTGAVESATSIDLGSVRLTDRFIGERPVPMAIVEATTDHAMSAFGRVTSANGAEVVGVAGTFTSLAGIVQNLPAYDRDAVDRFVLERSDIDRAVRDLAGLTVGETASIPSLDPKRASVILAGSIIAGAALDAVGARSVTVSEADLLVALANDLLASNGPL